MSTTPSSTTVTQPSTVYASWVPYLLLTLPLAVLLVVRPHSPDLIAQLARTAASRATNDGSWWTSWYGGISTRPYSLISPALMSAIGIWTVGAASLVVAVGATGLIIGRRDYARPAVFLVGIGMLANLASGRITFGLGVAAATLSVLFVRKHVLAAASAAAVVSFIASPLAGFFLGLVLLPLLWRSVYRRVAFACCFSLGVTFILMQILFPSTGYEPISLWQSALMVGGAALVMTAAPSRYLRTLALLLAVLSVLCLFVSTPIGSNILRLPLVFAPAAVLLESRRRLRLIVPALVFFLGWLAVVSGVDVLASRSSSATEAFYFPLLKHLPAAGTASNRVEVVDPATHGPSLYVAPTVPLARGWERQLDASQNELFYDPTLTSSDYHQWLRDNAVRWVAVPKTSLDYASVKEARLIGAGLPYLTRVWHSANWSLYEVKDYTPIAGAPVSGVQVKPDAINFGATGAGWAEFRVGWVRNMRVVDSANSVVGQAIKDGSGTRVFVPAAGAFSLSVS